MPRIRPWWDEAGWTEFAASVTERAISAVTAGQAASRLEGPVMPIPELVPSGSSKSPADGRCGEAGEFAEQATELAMRPRDQLRSEASELGDQIWRLRQQRDQLRTELEGLNDQVPDLRRERDELLAAVAPLRTELADLPVKHHELDQLESQIQALRHQKSSLDREILSDLRRSTENLRIPPNGRRFDDS